LTGLRRKAVLLVATGLGSGYVPVASGTFGTLVAVPLGYLLSGLGPAWVIVFVVGFCALAVWSAGVAEGLFGQKDSGRIVVDEIAGFLVTMLFVSWRTETVVAGFFLFRFMDILKPFPIRLAEKRLPGGWGVVGDDLLAGLFAQAVLRILLAVGLLHTA
jgi:phosphatidylglycerophosphatase A